MLTARYPRAAKTFARKEYSVNLTVLPWLRIATGSVIMSAFACISLSRRTAMSTVTRRLSRSGSLNVSVSCGYAPVYYGEYAPYYGYGYGYRRVYRPAYAYYAGPRYYGGWHRGWRYGWEGRLNKLVLWAVSICIGLDEAPGG